MTKSAAVPVTGFRKIWRRWRFHLSALAVLLPASFAPAYFAQTAVFRGEQGLGQRELGEVAVGPWSVRFAEQMAAPPRRDGPAGYVKSFSLALCDTCRDEVKAAYIKVGRARSLRAAGALFYGTPYRQTAAAIIPDGAAADDGLWLTLEGWNGEVHHAVIPIAEASPVTAEWLRKRGPAQ